MMAAAVSHPLDVVKVRCQLRGTQHRPARGLSVFPGAGELSAVKQPSGVRNIFRTLAQIATKEGVTHTGRRGLYYGLSASLGRQAVFSTLRHGNYNALRQCYPNMVTSLGAG